MGKCDSLQRTKHLLPRQNKGRPLQLQERDSILLFTKIVTRKHVGEVGEAGDTRDVDHPTSFLSTRFSNLP